MASLLFLTASRDSSALSAAISPPSVGSASSRSLQSLIGFGFGPWWPVHDFVGGRAVREGPVGGWDRASALCFQFLCNPLISAAFPFNLSKKSVHKVTHSHACSATYFVFFPFSCSSNRWSGCAWIVGATWQWAWISAWSFPISWIKFHKVSSFPCFKQRLPFFSSYPAIFVCSFAAAPLSPLTRVHHPHLHRH